MKKYQILFAVFAAILFCILPAAAQSPTTAREWNVNNTDNMSYAEPYELYNTTAQIGYDSRTFGPDLGWVGHSSGLFQFMRQAPGGTRDHRKGPIGPNENVAIYNDKIRKYLKFYDRHESEAELTWTNTPEYEWQIHDQSARNGRVYFALFSNRKKKYLVHKVQNYGINLGWLDNAATAIKSFSVPMSAQAIINGWVPYLGTFGGKGNLVSVQNASQTATLLFIKPGKSTSDCSDPMATVRVAPLAMMTGDQMKTLYGSASPPFPISFLACLTTPTTQSISLTFLNITYR